jgi:hypothetical protein
MRRQALLALGVVAVAGCGSHHHRAAPPPAPRELIRETVAAAVASPGAKYDFALTATVMPLPNAKSKELQRLVAHPLRLSATGAIGRDVLSAQMQGPFPYLLRGAAVGRDWAYVNMLGHWYGPAPEGLAKIWPRFGTRVAAEGGAASFVTGAAAVASANGGWRLTGRASRGAIALLDELLGGFDPSVDAEVARASTAELDVDAHDRLPRRIVLDVDLDRAALLSVAEAHTLDVRGIARAHVHATMTFSDWGHPPAVERPAHAIPWHKLEELLG